MVGMAVAGGFGVEAVSALEHVDVGRHLRRASLGPFHAAEAKQGREPALGAERLEALCSCRAARATHLRVAAHLREAGAGENIRRDP